jgi:type IV pilus assembly protein PilM
MTETIGLDIGSHSIKLAGLKMTSKGPFLTCLGMKEIPPGKDKEDVNTFAETLKALLKEVDLKTKKVKLVVSGSGVHIKRITIPSIPKDELKEAVRWEIKAYLPFPVETAKIDFHILDEFIEDNIKKLDLIVVACPNSLIDRTLSIAKGAGLQPIHLDVSPFAFWNALLTLDHLKKEKVVALIDLGAQKTGIHLFKDGILQFSREVTPAGSDITRAIMEGIGSVEEPGLSERAERIKQVVGIPSEAKPEIRADESIDISKMSFLIRPMLERLAAEISRSLDYFRTQFNVERIDRLLLTGGGANLKNIASYLENELRLPAEHFNLFSKILFDPKKIDVQVIDRMDSMFTVALGAALSEPKRIELLPSKEPFLSKIQIGKLILVLAPLVTLLTFLCIIWYMNGQLATLQKERDEKMAKVKRLEPLRSKLTLLKENQEKLKQELSLFPSSMIVSVPYREVLREASDIVPDNVTLKLLSVQSKAKSLKKESQTSKPQEGESQKDEGMGLHLTGLAFGNDVHSLTALALIIERLERSPLFKNAKLVSADENKLYNRLAAEFEIICDITLDNPPSPPLGRGDFSRPDTEEAKAFPTPKGGGGNYNKEKSNP